MNRYNWELTLDMLSLILMIGSFFLRSQTTHLAVNVDAKICCTCRFQDTQATSSGGCDFCPGVIGASGFVISQIKISDSEPPEASRFGCEQKKKKVYYHL